MRFVELGDENIIDLDKVVAIFENSNNGSVDVFFNVNQRNLFLRFTVTNIKECPWYRGCEWVEFGENGFKKHVKPEYIINIEYNNREREMGEIEDPISINIHGLGYIPVRETDWEYFKKKLL